MRHKKSLPGFTHLRLCLAWRCDSLQIFAEVAAELWVRERVFHGRLQVAELAAAVVALAVEAMRIHRLLCHKRADAVRELNLSPRALADLFQVPEDGRRQDITADNGEIGWRGRRLWLLDDAADAAGA